MQNSTEPVIPDPFSPQNPADPAGGAGLPFPADPTAGAVAPGSTGQNQTGQPENALPDTGQNTENGNPLPDAGQTTGNENPLPDAGQPAGNESGSTVPGQTPVQEQTPVPEQIPVPDGTPAQETVPEPEGIPEPNSGQEQAPQQEDIPVTETEQPAAEDEPQAEPEEEPAEEDNPEEEEQETAYPAQSFHDRTGEVQVDVSADEGTFPADTTMRLSAVPKTLAMEAVQEAMQADPSRDGEVVDALAVDITFVDVNGTEIQPRAPDGVHVTLSALRAISGEAQDVAHIEHLTDAAQQTVTTILESHETDIHATVTENAAGEAVSQNVTASFDAEHFSVYAIFGTGAWPMKRCTRIPARCRTARPRFP